MGYLNINNLIEKANKATLKEKLFRKRIGKSSHFANMHVCDELIKEFGNLNKDEFGYAFKKDVLIHY